MSLNTTTLQWWTENNSGHVSCTGSSYLICIHLNALSILFWADTAFSLLWHITVLFWNVFILIMSNYFQINTVSVNLRQMLQGEPLHLHYLIITCAVIKGVASLREIVQYISRVKNRHPAAVHPGYAKKVVCKLKKHFINVLSWRFVSLKNKITLTTSGTNVIHMIITVSDFTFLLLC